MGRLVHERHLLELIGNIPPAEHEEVYYRSLGNSGQGRSESRNQISG